MKSTEKMQKTNYDRRHQVKDKDFLKPHDKVVVKGINKEGTAAKRAENAPRSYQIKAENINIICRNRRSLHKLPTAPEHAAHLTS